MNAIVMIKLIDLLIAGLAAYPIMQAKFQVFHDQLEKANAENRDMTDEEMTDIFAQADKLNEEIEAS